MDIEKTIEQLRSECLVMEEMGRQFVEKCIKARMPLDQLSAPKVRKKEPALNDQQLAKFTAKFRKSMLRKRTPKS